jgi:hypothetical protein
MDEGLIYHVIDRGNNRLDVFREPDDLQAFLEALFDFAQSRNSLRTADATPAKRPAQPLRARAMRGEDFRGSDGRERGSLYGWSKGR